MPLLGDVPVIIEGTYTVPVCGLTATASGSRLGGWWR
jgi:hypothetical protein